MIFYKGISDIKEDLMGALKIVFSFDEDFFYDLVNPHSSRLKILNGYPREETQYPCIIATNATIKPKIYGIGNEFREYSSMGIGRGGMETPTKNYGSAFEYSVDFDCAAESTTERDQLTDRVSLYLWWACRQYLEEGGIILNDISSSGEEVKDMGQSNDKIYMGKINVKCWTEWTEIISHDVVESLNVRFQQMADIKRMNNLGTNAAIKAWSEKMTRSGRLEDFKKS